MNRIESDLRTRFPSASILPGANARQIIINTVRPADIIPIVFRVNTFLRQTQYGIVLPPHFHDEQNERISFTGCKPYSSSEPFGIITVEFLSKENSTRMTISGHGQIDL